MRAPDKRNRDKMSKMTGHATGAHMRHNHTSSRSTRGPRTIPTSCTTHTPTNHNRISFCHHTPCTYRPPQGQICIPSRRTPPQHQSAFHGQAGMLQMCARCAIICMPCVLGEIVMNWATWAIMLHQHPVTFLLTPIFFARIYTRKVYIHTAHGKRSWYTLIEKRHKHTPLTS